MFCRVHMKQNIENYLTKKMKKPLILFMILMNSLGYTQESFLSFINTPSDLLVKDVLALSDCYYVVGNKIENEENTYGFIYKIETNGNVNDSLFLDDVLENSTCSKGFQLSNNTTRIFGTKEKSDMPGFYECFLIDIDSEMNIINEIVFDLGIGKYWEHLNIVANVNNDLVIASMVDGSPPQTGLQYIDKMLIIVSQEGELLFDSIYNQSAFEVTMDFIKYPNSNNYILYCIKSFEEGNTLKQINILDTNFNLIENYHIEDYSSQASISCINNEYFLICNKGDFGDNDSWYTSVSKYDFSFNKLDQVYFGSVDTASYPALNNSIAYSNDKVFIGSTYNTQATAFPIYNSFVRIESLNNDLNLNFQRFYGGDAYYELIDIEFTIDGGCVLSGNKYSNGENGPFERDIFILKVDENGLVTSTIDEQNFRVKNAIITPNPGKDYLQLHTGISHAKLQLHSINGHMAMEKKVNINTTTINTQSLKSGTYIWSLLKDGQIIEKGKWIKE